MPDITMTQDRSFIHVMYNGAFFTLSFPFDREIIARIKKINGWDFNNRVDKKWTVPKESYSTLVQEFGEKIKWKTMEELKKSAQGVSVNEEKLEDVLSRVPKKIDMSFMKIDPYHFQKLGIGWGLTQKGRRGKVYGGILADLMGLGKTLQAIGMASYLKHHKKIKKCLVVCPSTLKMQWTQEVHKFTNEKSILIDGPREKRMKLYQRAKEEDILFTIVNYELLYQKETIGTTKDGKKQKGDYVDLACILQNDYDMIVLDEAHRMKNPDTQTATAIRQINPKIKLLMTGTPIEKDLQNIFQLADYISPNIFSSDEYDFAERRLMFEEKFLITGWNAFALKYGRREKIITGVKNVGVLKEIVAPYMLRRTTEDVSDEMPGVQENVIVVDWDKDQRKLYETIQNSLFDAIEKQGKAKTEEEQVKYKNESNAMIMYLLETCDSPELIVMSDSILAKKQLGKKRNFKAPPKLNRLVEMVEDIVSNKGEKVVIFTKFERMTQILKRELQALSEKLVKEGKKKPGGQTNPFAIQMYTGKVEQGCAWREQLEKQNKEATNLQCKGCPFYDACDTRTKAAWHFQNDPDTKVIIATDAANYGVNTMAPISRIDGDVLKLLLRTNSSNVC